VVAVAVIGFVADGASGLVTRVVTCAVLVVMIALVSELAR
jgi:hypothetical protein